MVDLIGVGVIVTVILVFIGVILLANRQSDKIQREYEARWKQKEEEDAILLSSG